ncbi:nitroreductase [bacterium (candidate division B38) B3_B38]|nr:MAG: nitroreductase [bacterium (candidate division B38) B3_B38]
MKGRSLYPSLTISLLLTLLLLIPGSFTLACRQEEKAQQPAAEIKLPPPSLTGKVSVEEAIKARRTIRSFQPQPLTLSQVSQLLWAAQGITGGRDNLRAVASAGALDPIEMYMVVGDKGVEGLEAGIYHYLPKSHSVEVVKKGDYQDKVVEGALGQQWIGTAPIVMIVTAEYARTTVKYKERGIRYVHVEVGHVGQNIFLQAEAIGLGAGIVGAYSDEQIAKVLGLPSEITPLLIMPVGYKK